MKAMGYAQQVIESISGSTSTGVLSWTGKKSGSDSGSGSLDIKSIKVNNCGNADTVGGYAESQLAKKSDRLNYIPYFYRKMV